MTAPVDEGPTGLLRLLRDEGAATRAELAERTGWARSAIALRLGGTLAEAGEYLLAGVREIVYRRSPPLATSTLRIARSTSGQVGLHGAAAFATDAVLASASTAGDRIAAA